MSSPKIRFKGFTEDWSKKRLDSFLQRVSKPVDVVDVKEYVQIGIRSHGKGIFHKESVTGKELGNKRVFWVVPNALVVNIVFAWERAIAVTSDQENGLIASHRFPMYLPKNGLSDVNFLRYLFITDKGQSYLELASPGGAGRNKTLGQSNFAELKIDLPLIEEQTKIASFLSAVDEKISQLTQKYELLSQYKQGMMQKLFSQQIRFKADDGSEFGEWENKTLSNFIIKHIGGASLTPSDFVEQSEYEVIPKKAIVPNGYLNLDKNNPTYCSEDFFKANLKNTVDNTYLVTVLRDLVPSGPSIGYIVKYMENTQYILAQGVYGFKLTDGLNKDFLIHFSNTKTYRLVMQSIMVGSTQVHIRNQDFFGIEIPVPCLEEQTKIANFVSAIDQKIEKVAQQIKETKQWKKGLLQQMFV